MSTPTHSDEWHQGALFVIDALKDFLPTWNYPPHVVAAISLEIKTRVDAADHVDVCLHEWLDRPESDSRVCLICGDEEFG